MTQRHRAAAELEERTESFLALQQRIVADFERSLANARQFIDLAGVSMSREPEETTMMLEQVREIDLLRHISEQFENFEGIATMLAQARGAAESGPRGAAFAELRKRYEVLQAEAEEQAERIATILTSINPVN